MRRTFLPGILILSAVLLFSGPAPGGDADVAKLLFDKGEKAFRAENYEEALEHYRRALAESSPYPEAEYALGQTLEKLNRNEDAIAAYVRCIDEVRALPTPSRTQKRSAADAEKAIARIGPGYAQLAQMEEALFKQAMDLARQSMSVSPEWARRFLTVALKVKPDHPTALEQLKQLSESPGRVEGTGEFEPQLNPEAMKGWYPGLKEPWILRDGILEVDARGGSHMIAQRDRKDGRYVARAAFRVLEDQGDTRTFGLLFGRKPAPAPHVHGLLLCRSGDLALTEMARSGGSRDLRSKIIPRFRWDEWHVLEIRVEGDRVRCLLDGQEQFTQNAEGAGDFEGNVGLFVQEAKVQIRDLGITR